jgi:glycosidase
MKFHFKSIVLSVLLFQFYSAFPQVTFQRVDPPGWWVGMADSSLQLLVYGNEIALANVKINYPGVILNKITRLENPDYLVIDLVITKDTRPGKIPVVFEYQREILFEIDYELNSRNESSADRAGFGKNDVIYLVMPDRFSNGNQDNDTIAGMIEPADRSNPDGRHGGDLKGIRDQLQYIGDLGVTALWLNPVLENNMPDKSYHGYAITDFYRVDPRLGANDEYRSLVEACHERGIKVIMDMVFNHCGANHPWIYDMPSANWIHQFPEFTRSNFRIETTIDPYASEYDLELMNTGWFDKSMPDLDQQNNILATYLVQNSIWWVEFAGLDGIRMDTYPYSSKEFMARWIQRLFLEYPNFNVVGETWLQKESHTAYWQAGSALSGAYSSSLPSVTDFPLQYAIKDALNEKDGWTTGLTRIYYVLSQDFMYPDPFQNVIFADNHDLSRLFTSLGQDYNKFKIAMTILLTTRGIPMIYYGTELLMTGEEPKGHGYIREDFPLGSWQQTIDSKQPATGLTDTEGGPAPVINSQQKEAMQYVKTLLKWRKHSDVVHQGKLKQFLPNEGIYVYFRYTDKAAVMVVINKNKEVRQLDLSRFQEVLKDYKGGKEVVSGKSVRFEDGLDVASETALVMELINQ